MKSFKIREGSVVIDGIHYQSTPCDTVVMGKFGRIQSINIGNRGQFFPVFGEFDEGTIPLTEDSNPIMEETQPIKKTRKTK